MSFFREVIEDSSGMSSATRLVFVVWGLVVTGGWLVVGMWKGVLQDIPASVVTMTTVLAGLKVWQKEIERGRHKGGVIDGDKGKVKSGLAG